MKIPSHSGQLEISRFNRHMKKLSQVAQKAEKNSISDSQLREATREFESMFLHQLMKAMRATVPQGDLFHGGQSGKIYTDMLDQEIAKVASKRGVGMANLLYQQLRRT